MTKHKQSDSEKLNQLLDTIALVNAETDLDKVLAQMLRSAKNIVGADASSVLLVDSSGRNLQFVSAQGAGAHEVKRFTIPIGEGVAGRVADKGKTIVVQNADSDVRHSRRIADELKESHQALVALPLKVKKRTVGVMEVIHFSKHARFSDDDVKLLEAFAGQAALAIEKARAYQKLSDENRGFKSALAARYSFSDMITASHAMQPIVSTARKVARTNSTVLITGESGTGKEVLAHAIHGEGLRSDGPFLVINCGAIPENLLESELFGYEKGAFTGAGARKIGKFELADGGTLFLDEIGELPLLMQVKLLRVLQERTIERVGGAEPISVDVRIIAATNKTLEREVAEKRFREDLFYRLNVIPLHIPPLRERREDIILLSDHFLAMYNRETGRHITGFSVDAQRILLQHSWPGNVRELQNIVERAVVLCSKEFIDTAQLSLGVSADTVVDGSDELTTFREAQQNFKRMYLQKALTQSGGNQQVAARLLGLQRTYLCRLMKELGLDS